jgi:hypothetical protein
MPATANTQKVECLNPNTGRKMNIEKGIYDLISKAIYHTLKKEGDISFTQLQQGVENCLKEQRTPFEGNIGWYTVSVKHDMDARGLIEVFTEKGKKLHRLKK